jgi:hypothetical protein
MSTASTRAPSLTSRLVIAAPIPDTPPVTTATRSLKRWDMILLDPVRPLRQCAR